MRLTNVSGRDRQIDQTPVAARLFNHGKVASTSARAFACCWAQVLRAVVVSVLVMICASGPTWSQAQAQREDVGAQFRSPDPELTARYRAIIDAPVSNNMLYTRQNDLYEAKNQAARVLGIEPREFENILQAWVKVAADNRPITFLAEELSRQGRFDESIPKWQHALSIERSPALRLLWAVALARTYFTAGRVAEAQTTLGEAKERFKSVSAVGTNAELTILLARIEVAQLESWLAARAGRWAEASAAAKRARAYGIEQYHFIDTQYKLEFAKDPRWMGAVVLATSLSLPVHAAMQAGRLGEAEEDLGILVKNSALIQFSRVMKSHIYRTAAELRFAQGEFSASERFASEADGVLASMGFPLKHPWRISIAGRVIAALEGQGEWAKGMSAFEALDAQADEVGSGSAKFPFERGLAYLHTGRARAAAPLFAELAVAEAASLGERHFFAVQALGLQGVALWRAGDPTSRGQAVAQLRKSVHGYMAPENADYLDNLGMRRFVRELVFSTYLEALSQTSSAEAVQAIGLADWLRASAVQDAVVDSAVRFAVADPALADLLRREQDAKNEIQGLRRHITAVERRPAQAIADARTRIIELEGIRRDLQGRIRVAFPAYDRLVRPSVPSVEEIARRLGPGEVFVTLLPTSDAVFVWAVKSSGETAFAKTEVADARLRALIDDLRRTLDFDAMSGGLKPFDEAASREVYRLTLAPVERLLGGASAVIVSAGGALSRVPMSVLLTRPAGGNEAETWLIKRMPVVQVASASAWLSTRAGGVPQRSSQGGMLGWGDPLFGAELVRAEGEATTRHLAVARRSAGVTVQGDGAVSAIEYSALPALPDTREELLAIAKVLGADAQRDLYLGERATRESVLGANRSGELAKRQVIVFATHGLMAGDLPRLDQPALALAANAKASEDPLSPLLKLDDVMGLKLDADWVVLSACNTAAADGKAEEALSGLARGFFYAGARSLLVTHWAVETESAKRLTTGTFEYYAAHPQAGKAESLRQSMLKLMADPQFAHPAFWAPYALVGDGGR